MINRYTNGIPVSNGVGLVFAISYGLSAGGLLSGYGNSACEVGNVRTVSDAAHCA
jgi:hypothetical protein